MAIGDMMGLLKQAKEVQDKIQEVQNEVAALEVTGAAGGGLVTVTMTGKGEMRKIAIDDSLLKPEEGEILEDLVVAASNEARARAETALADKMHELAGGLGLPPGMKLPF